MFASHPGPLSYAELLYSPSGCMNKHCFKLVHSPALGMLVPVHEHRTGRPLRGARRAMTVTLAVLVPAGAAAAGGIAPQGATQVAPARNGVPVIQIAAPDATGISHNRYTEFNVRQPGVVLNNSTAEGVSALAGRISGNPGLRGPARAILNEVTGVSPTTLEGALEVFGPAADVLVANPNGLTANGLSTINIRGLTLSTGRPGAGGVLEVARGRLEVGPHGVNTAGLSYFDLVARTVALHGPVGAGDGQPPADINVVAGANRYDYGRRTRLQPTGLPAAAPDASAGYAIDGSAAGAMYGRHITLVSSDAGLGVRHRGLVSAAGHIAIDAAGGVSVQALAARTAADGTAGSATVRAGGDALIGDVAASGGDIEVRTAGRIAARGALSAPRGRVQLQAGDALAVHGPVQAARIALATRGDASIAAELHATRDGISLTARNATLEHARVIAAPPAAPARQATPTIDIALTGTLTLRGTLHGADDGGRRIEGTSVALADGMPVIVDTRQPPRAAPNALLASDAGLYAAGQSISIRAAGLHNEGGAIDSTGAGRGHIGLHIGGAAINQGYIATHGTLAATVGGTLENRMLISAAALRVAARDLSNHAAMTASGPDNGTAALDLAVERRVDNAGSLQAPRGALRLRGGAELSIVNQPAGLIRAHGQDIAAARLANAGTLSSSAAGTLTLAGDLENSGVLQSAHALRVQARRIASRGRLATATDGAGLTLAADESLTLAGRTSSAGALLARAGSALVNEGIVTARQDLSWRARTIVNDAAGDVVARSVDMRADQGFDHRGAIGSETDLVLKAAHIDSAGMLRANQDIDMHADDAMRLKAGARTLAGRDLALAADRLEQSGMTQAGRTLTATAGALENGGSLDAADARLQTTRAFVNRGQIQADMLQAQGPQIRNTGVLRAGALLALQAAGRLENTGSMAASGSLSIAAGPLANSGTMAANRDAAFALGSFANNGSISVGGDLALRLPDVDLTLDADHRLPLSRGTTRLQVASLDNRARSETPGRLSVQARGAIRNQDTLAAGQGLWLESTSNDIENGAGALLWSGADLRLRGSRIINREAAIIESVADMLLGARDEIDNGLGIIRAGGDLRADAPLLRNPARLGGRIVPAGNTAIGGGTYDHSHSAAIVWHELFADGAAGIRVPRYDGKDVRVAQSVVQAGGNLYLNQGEQKGRQARVSNQGRIEAVGMALVDGNVDNASLHLSLSVDEYLRRPLASPIVLRATDSRAQHVIPAFWKFHTLYQFLDFLLSNNEPRYIWGYYRTWPEWTYQTLRNLDLGYVGAPDPQAPPVPRPPVLDPAAKARATPADQALVAQYHKDLAEYATALEAAQRAEAIRTARQRVDGALRARYGEKLAQLETRTPEVDAAVAALAQTIFDARAKPAAEVEKLIAAALCPPGTQGCAAGTARVARLLDQASLPPRRPAVALFAQAMAAVLGPDWRGPVGHATLMARYADFKRRVATQGRSAGGELAFYPAQQTVLAGGAGLVVSGGRVSNGENVAALLAQNTTVHIGEQRIETPRGSIDAIRHPDAGPAVTVKDSIHALLENRRLFARTAPARAAAEPGSNDMPATPSGLPHPLYETRLSYLDQSHYYGSSYFFDLIRYRPERPLQTIGDNYFETQLIREQISRAMGGHEYRHAVRGLALVRSLMDAAPLAAAELGLRVGQAPTAEQLARATRDFVWYVRETIDGQEVLVPRVYLTRATQAAARATHEAGGALMASAGTVLADTGGAAIESGNAAFLGKDVILDASGGAVRLINDKGIVGGARARDALAIRGGDIAVQGGLLDAAQAYLMGERVSLAASARYDAHGRLASRRDARLNGHADAAGLLHIAAKRVDSAGATLSGDHVRLEADQVRLGGLYDVDSSYSQTSRYGLDKALWFLSSQTETSTASHARFQGTTLEGTILSGRATDMDIEGGSARFQQTDLQVAHDFTVRAAADHAYAERAKQVDQLFLRLSAGAGGYEAGIDLSAQGGLQAHAGRDQTAGAHVSAGFESTRDYEMSRTTRYHNADLNFGAGLLAVGNTADLGGADINRDRYGQGANPTSDTIPDDLLRIRAARVAATKYLSTTDIRAASSYLRASIDGALTSSVLTAATRLGDTLAEAQQESSQVHAGQMALQMAGEATQLATADTAALNISATFAAGYADSHRNVRAENTNYFGGNLDIRATEQDIDLAGAKFGGADWLALSARRDINVRAAASRYQESGEQHDLQLHQTINVGANAMQAAAGVGVTAGLSGSHMVRHGAGQTHEGSALRATQLRMQARDLNLDASMAQATRIDLQVARDLNAISRQDDQRFAQTGGNWEVSLGAAIQNRTLVAPVGTIGGGVQHEHDNWVLTQNGQAGLLAARGLRATVGRDARLRGALVADASNQGGMDVAGRIHAEALHDYRDKDGYETGASVGISSTTLNPTLSLTLARPAVEQYRAVRQATIAMGTAPGAPRYTARAGVAGQLNTDSGQAVVVQRAERWASARTEFSFDQPSRRDKADSGSPGARPAHPGAAKAPAPPLARPLTSVLAGPSSTGPTANPTVAPGIAAQPAIASPGRDAAKPDPYANRVIVQLAQDDVATQAAQALFQKHAEQSDWYRQADDGSLHPVHPLRAAAAGPTKIQLVGHGSSDRQALSGHDGHAVAGIVQQLQERLPPAATLAKVALVGCDTDCASGASLRGDVAQRLAAEGAQPAPAVSGYIGRLDVDAAGRKHAVAQGGLGDTDPDARAQGTQPVPRVFSHGPINIAQSGQARQLVIDGHGSWVRPDLSAAPSYSGTVRLPAGTRMHFYSADGQMVSAIPLRNIPHNPERAWLSEPFAEQISAERIRRVAHAAKVPFDVARQGFETSTRVREVAAPGAVVKNYLITPIDPQRDAAQAFHQSRSQADVDLASAAPGKGALLSDLLLAVEASGQSYPLIHYTCCRGEFQRPGSDTPNPQPPPHEALIRSWLATSAPVHAQPLAPSSRAAPAAGADPYALRSIVQLGTDAATARIAAALHGKHAANSNWYLQDRDGQLEQIRQVASPLTGPHKIQFVGHGDVYNGVPLLGGNASDALAGLLGQVERASPAGARLDKVTLVGCDTDCTGRPSLREPLQQLLAARPDAPSIAVTGYTGRIDVDSAGHKRRVATGGLGDRPPADEPPSSASVPARLFTHGPITLSQSDTARQLIIQGHSGWTRPPADTPGASDIPAGWLRLPPDTRMHFYSLDHQLTSAVPVRAIPRNPELAWQGRPFVKEFPASAIRQFAHARRAPFDVARAALVESTRAQEVATAGSLVKNYRVSPAIDPLVIGVEQFHAQRRQGDVDLAVARERATLSDVLAAIDASGHHYPLLHFTCCRSETAPPGAAPGAVPPPLAPVSTRYLEQWRERSGTAQPRPPSPPGMEPPVHGPDRYGHRTIVQLGTDPLTEAAARRLVRKHAGNTSWYSQSPTGQLTQVQAAAAPASGPQKIQFVGHGSVLEGMPLLGGNHAAQLAQMLPAIRQGLPAATRMDKITLVGCHTGCASRASLRNLLSHYLITTSGLSTEVKGYAGRVDVDAAGHKQIVEQGGLGNTPPPEAAPAPRVFRHGNVTLSQSGEARQLMIVGHGSWPLPGPAAQPDGASPPGWVRLPANTSMYFYSRENQLVGGLPSQAALRAPMLAAQGRGAAELFSRAVIRGFAQQHQLPFDVARHTLVGATRPQDIGKPGALIKDYVVSPAPETGLGAIDDFHAARRQPDMDLAQAAPGTEIRLSEILQAVAQSGVRYDLMHYACCRGEIPATDTPTQQVATPVPAPDKLVMQQWHSGAGAARPPSPQAQAPYGPDRYAHRVIVQLGSDTVTESAARRLFRKHAETSLWYGQTLEGTLMLKQGDDTPAPGPLKIQFVGHGGPRYNMPLLGGNTPAELAHMASTIQRAGPPSQLEKVTLVGCQTDCVARPSLRKLFSNVLATEHGLAPAVTGYAGRVDVDAAGRKHIVEQGGLNEPQPQAGASAAAPNRIVQSVAHGVALSQSGQARQLVVLAHGGWKDKTTSRYLRRVRGDGYTELPANTRIDYYTEDGMPTKGHAVYQEVTARPNDAYTGLQPTLAISPADLEALARMHNTSPQALTDAMLASAVGRRESIIGAATMKNYALYYHEQFALDFLRRHNADGSSADVDLAIITEPTHKRHLSDVLKAAGESGAHYDVVHFGACRVGRCRNAAAEMGASATSRLPP
ncbi:filamentous hemagglutinin N-terminal domain-containing protein [Bordetella bronchiseptica]|uniref:C80 family cysteine peptidase n=1 Tax=Bordetella bronchiseptica TaxID=518 RepID=UPI00143E0FD3|nr:filamentous hemagglutinin N-terminal domain-containing protein [Bordetella bronchiseptica]